MSNSENLSFHEGKKVLETEFPSDPEQRMNLLLGAFNTGPKAITQLLLPSPGSYITFSELAKQFKKAFAGTPLEDFSRQVPAGYCQDSLGPIGLVAQEYKINYAGGQQLAGFGMTEAGQNYGIAAACLALDFETKYNTSLYPIFGQTAARTPDLDRAPVTRAKILSFLSQTEGELREIDIVEKFGISYTLARDSLQALHEAGAIFFESDNEVVYGFGEVPLAEVKQYKDHPTLTENVVAVCVELKTAGVPITVKNVFKRMPESIRNQWKEKALRKNIGGILPNLATQGFLTRGKFTGSEVMSAASISAIGDAVVADFLVPLAKLTQDDPVTREDLERNIIPKVQSNLQQYATNSGNLYYPYSKSYRAEQKTQNIAVLLDLIGNSPEGLSVPELADATGLNINTVRSYVKQLFSLDQVTFEERSGAHYYMIKFAEE